MSKPKIPPSWNIINRERGKLIDKEISGTITNEEQILLNLLQDLTDEFTNILFPRPLPPQID